jgi:hypothetical protein
MPMAYSGAVDLPPSHAQVVKPGRLPVTEFAFDRAGAASPFGDDVRLPLAAETLSYVHPDHERSDAEEAASGG